MMMTDNENNNIVIRFAKRADLPTLARIANAGNAKSVIHRRIAPYQDQFPTDYYHWRRNILRQSFATPNLRTIVAEDAMSGEVMGLASWAVEGPDTPLYKQWVGERSWTDLIDSKLVQAEQMWSRYITNKCIDYNFLDTFVAAFTETSARPACLHCHLIVVDPSTQSRGVGRMLIDWGKQVAGREDLPLYLESTLEATGFYDKIAFSRLSRSLIVTPNGQEPLYIPVFVWEGTQREGRWLQPDLRTCEAGQRWRWRDDALSR